MPQQEHLLEHVAGALAGEIEKRVSVISNALTPKGSRPPFTQQLSKGEALDFWRRHRNDATGMKVLQYMKPEDIMELDKALMSAEEGNLLGVIET